MSEERNAPYGSNEHIRDLVAMIKDKEIYIRLLAETVRNYSQIEKLTIVERLLNKGVPIETIEIILKESAEDNSMPKLKSLE